MVPLGLSIYRCTINTENRAALNNVPDTAGEPYQQSSVILISCLFQELKQIQIQARKVLKVCVQTINNQRERI